MDQNDTQKTAPDDTTSKPSDAIQRMVERQSRFWNDQFSFSTKSSNETLNTGPTISTDSSSDLKNYNDQDHENYDEEIGLVDLDANGCFDWLVDTQDILDSGILPKLIQRSDKIHIVGVGMSWLPMALYDLGYLNITASDISEVLIASQKRAQGKLRPGIEWIYCDILNMNTIQSKTFDIILDKCTSDTLQFRSRSKDSDIFLHAMVKEVKRTLTDHGKFIVISPRRRIPALDDESAPTTLIDQVRPQLVDSDGSCSSTQSKTEDSQKQWSVHPIRTISRRNGDILLTPTAKNGALEQRRIRTKV